MGRIGDFIKRIGQRRLDVGKNVKEVENAKNPVEEICRQILELSPEQQSQLFKDYVEIRGKENPPFKDEFVKKIIEKAADEKEPEFTADSVLRMLKDLPPETKLDGDYVLSIAKKIREEIQNINKQLQLLESLKRNARIEKMSDGQKEALNKIEQEIMQEIKDIQETEQKKARKKAIEHIHALYNNKDVRYWRNQANFYSINKGEIQSFEDNEPSAEELKEFKKDIAKLIAKKKAVDFAKIGSTIISDSDENLDFEDMILFDVPNLAQKEYNKFRNEDIEYKNIEVKEQITKLILEKMARSYIIDYKDKNENGQLYIPPVISMIKKNNPQMTEEQIREFENIYLIQTEAMAKSFNVKNIDIQNVSSKLKDEDERIKAINGLVKQIEEWPLKQIQTLERFAIDKNKKQETKEQDETEIENNTSGPNMDDDNNDQR